MLELFIGEELAGRALVRPDVAEPASFEAARPELALFDAQAEKLAAQRRLVKSATRPRFGLFAQGYYGYPGMDCFESMIGERLVVECARRIPDVVEFRGVLHEEEFAGQTPHGTAAARCAARRLPLQHTVADRRGERRHRPPRAARCRTTTALVHAAPSRCGDDARIEDTHGR